jgi:hypothetical protein
MSDATDFKRAAMIQFPNGKSVVLVAEDDGELEFFWNKLATGRVPLRREMIETVEIKRREKK